MGGVPASLGRVLWVRDKYQIVAGTFHAVAYAQLRTRWAERNITPPTLLDRKVGFVARLMPTPSAAPRAKGAGVI